MLGGEPAIVLAGDHVATVGLEDAGIGPGLGEDFADHFQVVTEGGGEAEPFGEAGGVDVHHHVDEGLHLGGFSDRTDVAQAEGKILEELEMLVIDGLVGTDHEVELAVAGVADAARHAGFDGGGAGLLRGLGHGLLDAGGEGRAIDEGAALRAGEEVVALAEEDLLHRGVVGHDGEDDVGLGGDVGELFAGGRAQFRGEGLRGLGVHIVDGGDFVLEIVEAAGHIGPHASDADKSNAAFRSGGFRGSFLRGFFGHNRFRWSVW